MIILGIGGILSDAASTLARDGVPVAAAEEKKLTRESRPGSVPWRSIATCLELAGAAADDVDAIAIARPLPPSPESSLHLELRTRFPKSQLVVVEHHTAHAASAFYASPFDEAAVLTLDRGGDFRCGARWHGAANQLVLERDNYFPDSLGDLYGRVTELLGFNARVDEHKVQWLSAAGDDRFAGLFRDIISPDWPRLDRSYFSTHRVGGGSFSAKFFERLGVGESRQVPEALRSSVAKGVQAAVEQAVVAMANGAKNVCLAGGLGLNALLVAALERHANVYVQPAAGNAGTALGAAYYAWHNVFQQTKRAPLDNLYLGPSFNAEQIKTVIENCKLRFRYLMTTAEVVDTALGLLGDSQIVAWMHGRMEFGPRALGNRSILASPLNPYSTENLNVYIKHREPFRKFAASVPAEVAEEYFEVGPNARFLATVGRVKAAHRKVFEHALMGEDMIRVHTVSEQDNPLYHRLLVEAGKATGLPVLYNTSFNLFGDPMVCSPRDAVRSFYSSGVDAMVVGNFVLQK
jgi:carbamoyltransferase